MSAQDPESLLTTEELLAIANFRRDRADHLDTALLPFWSDVALGLTPVAADPAPVGLTSYVWLKDDATLWQTVSGVATQIGGGGGGGGGITNSAGANVIMKSNGTNAVASQITDDGTCIKVPNFCSPFVDLGTLAQGFVDLDLTSYSVSDFKFSPDIGGTYIRSIKTKASISGAASAGQIIRLFNNGNSSLPGDYVAALTQDDGSALYSHIHLEGRQPWHVIPALGICELRLEDVTGKWHLTAPGFFQAAPRPIPITFAIADGNVDDLAPVDMTTGLNGRYASWFRCIPVAGTRLCGLEASAPTAGSNWSRRVLLTNYGAECTIAHGNSSGGASTYAFACPGQVDFTWRLTASVWACFDEGNHIWMLEAP